MGMSSQRALMKNSINQRERYFCAVGCRDDRPIVHTGSVVSTLPNGLCDVSSDRESAIQYEFGERVG